MKRFYFWQQKELLPPQQYRNLSASSTSAQSADKIIKQGIKAMGGEKALQRVTAWRATGSITRKSDGAADRYQAAAMRPDLYSLGVEIRGFEASAGFNGKSGW